MGSDAHAYIWYGIKTDFDNPIPSTLIKLLRDNDPYKDDEDDSLEDENEVPRYSELKYEGLTFKFFESWEDGEVNGFGVELLHTDWDDSPLAINLMDLYDKLINKIAVPAEKALTEWGVTESPQLFITCRYW